MALTPFTLSKIVLIGASITNQSFNPSTIALLEGYVLNKYGLTVSIVDEAVSGTPIADLRASIDATLLTYSGESNTHFAMHTGGNDVGNGSFFNQGATKQAQLIADLEYVYDAVQSAGHKLIQSALTFRDYNGTTLDPGLTLSNELSAGSYTWTRDWIVPVMQSKAPDYVFNKDGVDWSMLDAYNLSRNIHKAWLDPTDLNDKVHPSAWAHITHALALIDGIVQISLGNQPASIERRDFTSTYDDAVATDFIVGLNRDTLTGSSTANINWFDTVNNSDGPVFLDNLIDVDGNAVSNVKVYSYVNYIDDNGAGNSADNANDTASLANHYLLLSSVGINDAGRALHVVVDGLEAFKTYTLDWVVAANPTGSLVDSYYYPHDGIDSVNQVLQTGRQASPENEIQTATAVSDALGRLIFGVEEESNSNRSLLSGLRISAVGAPTPTPTSAAIDINISEPVFSIFASNSATVYYYSKGTQVRLF